MNTEISSTDNIIQFPRGLIGLSDQIELKLFHDSDHDEPVVHWLQSVTDANFSMSVITPQTLGMEYNIEFDNEDIESLQLEDPDDTITLLVIYKQLDNEDNIKVVTQAPIVINTKTKRGLQKPLQETVFEQQRLAS